MTVGRWGWYAIYCQYIVNNFPINKSTIECTRFREKVKFLKKKWKLFHKFYNSHFARGKWWKLSHSKSWSTLHVSCMVVECIFFFVCACLFTTFSFFFSIFNRIHRFFHQIFSRALFQFFFTSENRIHSNIFCLTINFIILYIYCTNIGTTIYCWAFLIRIRPNVASAAEGSLNKLFYLPIRITSTR